nr:cytochrome P450 2L1-like [Penaeus vannamei]
MITEFLLGLLSVVLLCLALLQKPRGLPPGRWGLPLLGSIPLSRKSLEGHLLDLRRRHGDIYVWRIGTQTVVFLHDYHMAKEAFTRPEFLNRPDWSIFKLMVSDNNSGVVGSSGATWHANRRFTLRQLRDLGMGKSRMVSVVQREAQCLAEELGKQAGRAAPVPHALTVCVLNVLWQLVASKRFSVDDPVILDLEGLIDDTLAKMARLTVPDFLPWLSRAFPLALQKRLFALDILEVMKDKFSRFCEELIDDHKQALDPSNPRDLIDAYLIDLQERRLIGEEETDRSKDLSKLVFDMFTAGSETTTNTLTWMLYYLAAFPDVQTKMQEEVDRVLPKDALPTLDDRPR